MRATPTHKIRAAAPADLHGILSIAAASPEAPQWQPADYPPYLTSDPSTPALLRTAIVALSQADSPGELLGFAAATLLLVSDSAGEQNLCQLDSMAVLPAARRLGLGSALVREILSWASKNGSRHLTLEVRASNTPAIRLYQSCGLLLQGRRTRYYSHPEEDALLLGMAVTSAPPGVVFPPEK